MISATLSHKPVAGNLMERAVVKVARREPKCAYSGDLVGDMAGRGLLHG